MQLKNPDTWEIDDGWKPMVKALVDLSTTYCHNQQLPFTLEQVKEKFGTLRFYYSGGDEYVHQLVDLVEASSGRVCEVCGKKATLRKDLGWLKTLCDEHYEQRKARKYGA